MRIRGAAAAVATAAMFAVGASACAPGPTYRPSEAAIPAFEDTVVPAAAGLTPAEGLEAFPSATPRDWVSYADHVSLFTVLDETQLPWGEHEEKYREGMVGREVTVRVDQLLWRSDTAPEIPSEYTAGASGWALTEGELYPMGMMGGPRLEVGEQYLGAWIYSNQDGWGVLSVRTVLPVDDYGRPQRHEWSEQSEAVAGFVGALPQQISQTLSATQPDPQVAKYAHLEPWARRVAVDLATLPDRPGFWRGVREKYGGQPGYVRVEDWELLQREQDPALEVPFYDLDGTPYTEGEGGGITIDGFVLEE